MQLIKCPYCKGDPIIGTGRDVYPGREDLAHKYFWICWPCEAWVGCHPDTRTPLGRLANAELRKAKQEVHAIFDTLWKNSGFKQRRINRSQAYADLAAKLGITVDMCHVGMFDIEMCKRAIEACKELKAR